MKASIIVASLLASCMLAEGTRFESLNPAHQEQVKGKLSKWKALYGRIAEKRGFKPPTQERIQMGQHSDEELKRFQATIAEVELVSKQNPHAKFSEYNQFALLNDQEFAGILGSSFGNHSSGKSPTTTLEQNLMIESGIDWTASPCMPPVRDQGNCGSCWAFSTIGTAESAHCLATGELLDLAEQQVVSCDSLNHGCKGGYPPNALDWIANGVCTEDAWQYTSGVIGQTGQCTTKCTKKQLALGEVKLVGGEDALLNALNKQPVTVIVEAGNSVWKNYKSGVVTQCPGSTSNHAVIAVGYGASTTNYFKIKNSWGPEWGQDGYIYLQRGVKGARGDGMCNVAEAITYPELAKSPSPSSNAPSPTSTLPTPLPSTSSIPTAKPMTVHPSVVPSTSMPSTKSPTLKPSTSAVSTTKVPTPIPTTPSGACGKCKGCFFADVKWCVNVQVKKAECENSEGAHWCGE